MAGAQNSVLAAVLLLLSCTSSTTAFAPELRQIAPLAREGKLKCFYQRPIGTQRSSSTNVDASDNNDASNKSNNNRRSFLTTATATVWVTCASSFNPPVAHATYGADAKMVMPDVVQGMTDRQNKQCLVESLGNRECMVYLDPENQLYKGTDAQLMFERLEGNVVAFKNVPQYIDTKQWSKVLGVLTGPMGSLSYTMNELVKINDGDESVKNKCKTLTVDIRKDLYAIAAAVDKKNGKDALISYEKAVEKLENFVSLVSS